VAASSVAPTPPVLMVTTPVLTAKLVSENEATPLLLVSASSAFKVKAPLLIVASIPSPLMIDRVEPRATEPVPVSADKTILELASSLLSI